MDRRIERTDPHPDLHRRICYAAQQAAEKAVKAIIAHHGEQPAKTHHLGNLIERAAAHADVPDDVRRAYLLTEYVVTTRSTSAATACSARCRVPSTTPRQVTNIGDDDLVLLIVGGKDGYGRPDGQPVAPLD